MRAAAVARAPTMQARAFVAQAAWATQAIPSRPHRRLSEWRDVSVVGAFPGCHPLDTFGWQRHGFGRTDELPPAAKKPSRHDDDPPLFNDAAHELGDRVRS